MHWHNVVILPKIKNVTDIILDAFGFTSITDDLIDLAEFTDAKATVLKNDNYTGILTKPTGVGEVINDLLFLAQAQIYFNTVENRVNLLYTSEFAATSISIRRVKRH